MQSTNIKKIISAMKDGKKKIVIGKRTVLIFYNGYTMEDGTYTDEPVALWHGVFGDHEYKMSYLENVDKCNMR